MKKILLPLLTSLQIYCCTSSLKNTSLNVIMGPMMSGKTEKLLKMIHLLQLSGHKVLAFKHSIDTRHLGFIKSRADNNNCFQCLTISDCSSILNKAVSENPRVVAIDEAQFFSTDLVPIINNLLDLDINVIVSGLDMNFKREPFGSTMGQLAQIATKVTKMVAICQVCRCHNATLSQRLVNGKPAKISDIDIIVDDGTHTTISYEPRCRNCHQID